MENKNTIEVNGAIIKSVSSPNTLMRVARDKDLNPQEVFVRITFEVEGKEYSASNKLKYLTRAGYQSLLDAKASGTPMDLAIDVEGEYFYINTHTSIDDLFAKEVAPVQRKYSLTDLLH